MTKLDQKPKATIEYIATSVLIPYARNSRTHSDEQVAQIAASIKEFGFTNPVLVDDENVIIAGHGRVLAAQRLGLDQVPSIRIGYLTEAQKRAYVIADNKLALNAGWDNEMLALELGELADLGFDVDLTGFTPDEIEGLSLDDDSLEEEGLIDDDEAPDPRDQYISARGDVWVLGGHRLMCGDSTVLDDVELLTAGVACDACWTDPPYNVAYEGGTKDKLTIQNDSMDFDSFYQFLYDAYVCMFASLKEGGPIYVAHADTEGLNFRRAFRDAGFKLSGCLVWAKNTMVLGRSDYQWKHEPILYGWKPGAAHQWFGARNKTTVIDAKDMPFIFHPDGRVQIDIGETSLILSGDNLQVEEVRGSIIRAEKPKRNGEHPTMKPVDLIVGMLKNSTRRGETVLDLFGGSGSTLIACEKLGRHARLMELDERYVDVIVRRWQDFTGKKAVLESTGQTFDELENLRKS